MPIRNPVMLTVTGETARYAPPLTPTVISTDGAPWIPAGVTTAGVERNSMRPAASRRRYQASIGVAAHPSATAACDAERRAESAAFPSMSMSALRSAPLHEV